MRAVVQRVLSASVSVEGEGVISQIGPGLLCLVGLTATDDLADVDFVARKLLGMRLWQGSNGKAWDLSAPQMNYDILCVSQFTLYGRLQGNKPDFSRAMAPGPARELYAALLGRLRTGYQEDRVHDGVFGAMMSVELVNDGPVTLIIDSVASEGRGGEGRSSGAAGATPPMDDL
jgi:D-tyrosyl-tRNA(Tyr) deacylase